MFVLDHVCSREPLHLLGHLDMRQYQDLFGYNTFMCLSSSSQPMYMPLNLNPKFIFCRYVYFNLRLLTKPDTLYRTYTYFSTYININSNKQRPIYKPYCPAKFNFHPKTIPDYPGLLVHPPLRGLRKREEVCQCLRSL